MGREATTHCSGLHPNFYSPIPLCPRTSRTSKLVPVRPTLLEFLLDCHVPSHPVGLTPYMVPVGIEGYVDFQVGAGS